jgi:TadE-like protein
MIFLRKKPFISDYRGVAAVEFALVLPLLLLLFLGGFELWRYVNTVQRIEGAAFQISNLVSQTVNPRETMSTETLKQTFNAILGGTAEKSNFVVSAIGRPRQNANPEVLFQQSSGLGSEYGTLGSPVSETINGINLTNRDIIVVTEVSYTHNNLLGKALENIGLIATNNKTSTDGGDGDVIKRASYMRYRRNLNFLPVNPVAIGLPPSPISCGNYRRAYKNNDNALFENNVQQYSFLFDGGHDKLNISKKVNGKIYSAKADEPHPCTCYGDTAVQYKKDGLDIQFRQQLSTCNPALASQFKCPTWSQNALKARDGYEIWANQVDNPLYFNIHPQFQKLKDLGFDQDKEYLPRVTLKCEPETTALEKECNGYVTAEDLYVPATDPLNFVKCPNNKPRAQGTGGSDGGGGGPKSNPGGV